ncbi:MAG: hypothetical protein V4613_14620 [Bacteroidota bacterium]
MHKTPTAANNYQRMLDKLKEYTKTYDARYSSDIVTIKELRESSSMQNLNVTTNKKFDFNIFKASRGNRSISLPPEFVLNLQ